MDLPMMPESVLAPISELTFTPINHLRENCDPSFRAVQKAFEHVLEKRIIDSVDFSLEDFVDLAGAEAPPSTWLSIRNIITSVPWSQLGNAINSAQIFCCEGTLKPVDFNISVEKSENSFEPRNLSLDQFWPSEEPGKVPIKGINFIVTDRCNITCDLCGPGCGPSFQDHLTADNMAGILREAAQWATISQVVFTGGEPTLFIDEICQAAKVAKSLGAKGIRLVTNGSFGKTRMSSDRTISKLKVAGFTEIALSVDDFHLVYIPLKTIRNVVDIALGQGISVNLTHKGYEGSKTSKETYEQALGRSILDNANQHSPSPQVSFSTGSTQMIGRGSRKYTEFSVPESPDEWRGPCSEMQKRINISPSGKLQPCCGLVDRGLPDFYGKSAIKDFIGAIKTSDQSVLNNWLALEGPSEILNTIEPNNSRSHTGKCEACQSLFSNNSFRLKVVECLSKVQSRLTLKRALYEAQRKVVTDLSKTLKPT